MKEGIAASPGIAIGKVFIKQKEELEIDKKEIDDHKQELKRLQNALDQAKEQIIGLKEKTAEKISKEKAEIFEAHLMFLDDPELIPAIKSKIRDEKINAEAAVDEMIEHYARIFSNMDNEYMQGREADIRDVGERVIKILQGETELEKEIDDKAVIFARELTPSDTAQLDTGIVQAFVTCEGSRTSHSAIMARSLETPAVVGLGEKIISEVDHGAQVIVDGNKGHVLINPNEDALQEYRKRLQKFKEEQKQLTKFKDKKIVTKNGKKIEVTGNIGNLADVDQILKNGGEGIGLFRTEFLYMDRKEIPDENEQFEVYRKVAEKMRDRPVVIRTLDIGGDKELSYLDQPEEMNPFLGYRAIRMCLDRPDIFKPQLKAILRASKYGNIKIMYPMVSSATEIKKANTILAECKEELQKEGKKYGEVEVGIMIETPSAALMADVLAQEVDFFSIGTNDLIQYTVAVDRVNEQIAERHTPYQPGVLRLIKKTIELGHKENIWVGMCGEAAANNLLLPFLLGAGLDEFSMSAVSILKIKELLSKWSVDEAKRVTEKALQLENSSQVKQYLKNVAR